jgi:tetratricopeptide (TPR) repeat protein
MSEPRWKSWVDIALLVSLAMIAVLLGCYEMGDSDLWWHLRGGQWILEHGRVPDLDPFTFGSADRHWVDIHWSYEVIIALLYRWSGVAGLIVFAALAGGGAFLAAQSARRRSWPAVVVVACWLPALVLFAFRLDPRPEILSLLYLGCYVAVLWRVDDRPATVWLLVPIQILWVNAQGLFVFGPVLLLLFVAAHALPWLWRHEDVPAYRWWWHVGSASLAVIAACLVNPYVLEGARFPFQLYPKVAEAGNIYKRYIDELMTPRDQVREASIAVAGTNWFFLAFYFLELLVPLSFLYPAVWRNLICGDLSPHSKRPKSGDSPPHSKESTPLMWLGGLLGAMVLLLINLFTLSPRIVPAALLPLGDLVAPAFLLAGLWFAWHYRNGFRQAALMAAVGGAAMAGWIVWLRIAVAGGGAGILAGIDSAPQLTGLLIVLGLLATILLLRSGCSLFRLLLAGAFAYLGLQALQNWSRFALVAGVVLTWNFGEWAEELSRSWKSERLHTCVSWCSRAGLSVVLGIWLTALLRDQYYVHTGEPRHFAFREQPLEFAHDAVLFAGKPGLPDRALVYGLGQTGLYTFHNAPERKTFMDGRLEMPDQKTFETYVAVEDWLRAKDPHWEKAVAAMGNPLILLEHTNNYGAEAGLLMHPDWRCIYYDALASIFVRNSTPAASFPPVDFAARHFADADAALVPADRGAAAREEKALFNLVASLPRSPALTWSRRIPMLWLALDRARLAVQEDHSRPDVWVLLGNCYWNVNPDLTHPPLRPGPEWQTEEGIYWAQATYCIRRALAIDPTQASAWRYLFGAYGARGMADAQLAAGRNWRHTDPKISAHDLDRIDALEQSLARSAPPSAAVSACLRQGLVEAAARVLDEMGPQQWDWPMADIAAGLYMHLGRPADARQVWQGARTCPSSSLRLARIASTYWVEQDFEQAVEYFMQSRAADARSADAGWGLAFLNAQLGRASPARSSCREALRLRLSPRQRRDIESLEALLRNTSPSVNGSPGG